MLLRTLQRWHAEARQRRDAHRLVRDLFTDPSRLAGTSLRVRHKSRWVHLGHDVDSGRVIKVRFGILRHPRPYAFSSQAHKVIEYYSYDVESGQIDRQRGVNLTRQQGRDAD